jgi:hypothetical protein
MSREKGDKLEEMVSQDLAINKTTNSGAKWGNADLTNRTHIVECKFKGKDSFQPCGSELKKLISAATKHNKQWIYVQQTNNNTFVVVDYEFFLQLYSNLNEKES